MIPELSHYYPLASGGPMLIDVGDRGENRRKASGARNRGARFGTAGKAVMPLPVSLLPAASRAAEGARRPRAGKAAAPLRADPFYTRDAIAAWCLARAALHFDFASCLLVEPSAGGGAFSRQMPSNTVAVDLTPTHGGILKADYLALEFRCHRPVITIGNPPFGKNASLARRFFNHAARQSDGIAMILPRSFRKAAIENCLDRNFHLVWEEDVPPRAFVHEGEPRDVAAVFQVWERRDTLRELRPRELTHPDFKFVEPALADFTVRRVGVNAGDIGHDLGVKKSTYYGVKGDALISAQVEAVMAALDLKTPAADATATRSLAKSEIVRAYRAAIEPAGCEKGDGSPAVAKSAAPAVRAARRRPPLVSRSQPPLRSSFVRSPSRGRASPRSLACRR